MPSFYRVGAEFAVNRLTEANQGNPAIAAFADGGFIIAWTSWDIAPARTHWEIRAQLFNGDGTRDGAEFQVNAIAIDEQFTPAVAVLANGDFVVAWVTNSMDYYSSNKGIWAQMFSRSGEPIGDQFKVNLSTGSNFTADVVALANGGFVISWDEWNGWDRKAQIYSAEGERVGPVITLNTNTDYAQEYGDIVALAGGGFVATWRTTDPRADGDRDAVKAQIFDAAGGRVGGEFLVNSYAVGYQNSSKIAALPDGGFVVVWASQDGSPTYANDSIRAQIYGPDGGRVGGEFLVNEATADIVGDPTGTILNDPVVTGLPDGGFMVAWAHIKIVPTGNIHDVKARVFDATGAKLGAEFIVHDIAAGIQHLPEIATLADGRVIVAWTSYDVDGSGQGVQARIFAPNSAPRILSGGSAAAASITVEENGAAVTTIAATDTDGPGRVRYAIAGGDDATLFVIDAETGALSFVDAPDFESPADADADNVYEVTVAASDGELAGTQALAVTVANVGEGNTIIGTAARNTIASAKTVPGQPFATRYEDTIYGLAGSDTLLGGGGADVIDGGAGADAIVGGAGADRLTGGKGADRFILVKTGESTVGAMDVIEDFGRGDRISLEKLDANSQARGNQSFAFIGLEAFSGSAGEVRYEQLDGNTFVSGDVNGDGAADFRIQLVGLVDLTPSDFIL